MSIAIKRVTLSFSTCALIMFLAMGIYNSAILQNHSFMASSTGINFSKRLDEIQGRVVIGRMAASLRPFKSKVLAKPESFVETKKVQKKNTNVVAKAQETKTTKTFETASPAILGDLEMTAKNAFFKKPLKQNFFEGSVSMSDGFINEIYIKIEGSEDPIIINPRERMVGNVFKYFDHKTNQEVSGLLYEVKPGSYMVTLTNHAKYAGLRMEFSTKEDAKVAYSDEYYDQNQSWGMDERNSNQGQARPNHSEDDYYADNSYDNNSYVDNYGEEGAPHTTNELETKTSFNFETK